MASRIRNAGIAMRSMQIVKGMIDGKAVLYETPDSTLVIPYDKQSELTDREVLGVYRRIMLSERVTAMCNVIESEPDDLGRTHIVTHTVAYKFDYGTKMDGAPYKFDTERFAEEAVQGKYKFNMPPMPVLKHPLDYPPAWEVVKQ